MYVDWIFHLNLIPVHWIQCLHLMLSKGGSAWIHSQLSIEDWEKIVRIKYIWVDKNSKLVDEAQIGNSYGTNSHMPTFISGVNSPQYLLSISNTIFI